MKHGYTSWGDRVNLSLPGQRSKASHVSGIRCTTHKIYSLTCSDYEALWERSGGRCEACAAPPRGRDHPLVIDHDHRYGYKAVRGLLCKLCNLTLGQLENPDVRPAFGYRAPGKWFDEYLRQAWFATDERAPRSIETPVDQKQLRKEVREWKTHNKALFTTDPRVALVPLDKPSVIVEILREEMSGQGFAALIREIHKVRGNPKGRGTTAA
jgi:hypothetical protein